MKFVARTTATVTESEKYLSIAAVTVGGRGGDSLILHPRHATTEVFPLRSLFFLPQHRGAFSVLPLFSFFRPSSSA